MASELRVDKIVPTAGAPTGGGGGIVQVVYTHIAAAGSSGYSNNSTTYNDTGHDVLITPKFATSKILVSVGVQIYATNSAHHSYVGIVRNDSGDLSGSGHPSGVLHHTSCLWESSGPGQAGNVSFQYLDSPSTTSQVKYSIYIKSDNASNTVYINGSSYSDGYISAMEFSA
tara:strand:- start:203 stop:715 length:513 start_codon:yes stop_codon:yes gene_type:complete